METTLHCTIGTDVANRLYSMNWAEQSDRSVAADFLERVSEMGGALSLDTRGVWWLERVPDGLAEVYGVRLDSGERNSNLKPASDFRPPGMVMGQGERLTLDGRESDMWLAAAFLLDRVEGVSLAQDGTLLLDSPYAGGSTARARNFAEQFGLTVTLNDDPRLRPKWELRRPRLGVAREVPAAVRQALDRYRAPWSEVNAPSRRDVDTWICMGAGAVGEFRRGGCVVIEASQVPVTIDGRYRLTPVTAKRLLRDVYLGSARAI